MFAAIRKKEIKPIEGPKGPWLLIVVLLILLAGAVSYLGERPSSSDNSDKIIPEADSRTPRVYTVSYKSGVFSPTNLRIHAGDTVRFKNESFFGIHMVTDPHPRHDDLPGFDSIADIPQISYFSFTFSSKGIFGYHNENDPEEGGTIIVR